MREYNVRDCWITKVLKQSGNATNTHEVLLIYEPHKTSCMHIYIYRIFATVTTVVPTIKHERNMKQNNIYRYKAIYLLEGTTIFQDLKYSPTSIAAILIFQCEAGNT